MHVSEILTFNASTPKKKIEAICDDWGDKHRDWHEGGGHGLPSRIKWKDSTIFDDYEEAQEYLDGLWGNYLETAVLYYSYPQMPPTKKETELTQRISDCLARIGELEAPHFVGVKSRSVSCKNCGSSIATAYCGKSWNNHCPVCKSDLRPQTVIENLKKAKDKYKVLQKELRTEEKKAEEKLKKKAILKWAIACEVHC